MTTEKLDYIVHKLDIVTDKVADINSHLEVYVAKFDAHVAQEDDQKEVLKRNTEILYENTTSLKDHMQRTDLLEAYIKKIDERFTPVEMAAMRKKAVSDWGKSKLVLLAKLGGATGGIGAIAAIIKFLIHYLS